MNLKPNKAPEPTTTAVTRRAVAFYFRTLFLLMHTARRLWLWLIFDVGRKMISGICHAARFCPLLVAGVLVGFATDVSGVYIENGMTIRASSGLPSVHVSLCGLLSRVFDPAQHKELAREDRTVRITVHSDLLLEILISGGLPGDCVFSRTKAEGMRLDAESVVFTIADKARTTTYRFTLDAERRLLVSIDVSARDGRSKALHETGVYAFSRK